MHLLTQIDKQVRQRTYEILQKYVYEFEKMNFRSALNEIQKPTTYELLEACKKIYDILQSTNDKKIEFNTIKYYFQRPLIKIDWNELQEKIQKKYNEVFPEISTDFVKKNNDDYLRDLICHQEKSTVDFEHRLLCIGKNLFGLYPNQDVFVDAKDKRQSKKKKTKTVFVLSGRRENGKYIVLCY